MIKKNQIYIDKVTGGKYRVTKVERDYISKEILNVKLQNINDKNDIYDFQESGIREKFNLLF